MTATRSRASSGRCCRGGDVDGARQALAGRTAPAATVAAAGLDHFDRGSNAVGEAMAGVKARLRIDMERNLGVLGTLGNNAPFIGLFGTVLGIIKAFADLARNQSGGAAAVMSGISEALVATAVGLMVAIPAVIAFNYFQGKVRKTIARVDAIAHLVLATIPDERHRRGAAASAPRPRASAMAGGSSSYGNDDDSGRMIVDINVTPLVDITLVLLIIFMVTASYIVSPAIKVDLPKAASGTEQTKTTLALTLTKDGRLFLNGQPSSDDAVVRHIGAELPKNPELQAIIAADKAVPHGDVIHVIDMVKRAGVHRFAISIDQDSGRQVADRGGTRRRSSGPVDTASGRRARRRAGGRDRRRAARPAGARGGDHRSEALSRRDADRDRRRREAAAAGGEAAAARDQAAAARAAPARRPPHADRGAAARRRPLPARSRRSPTTRRPISGFRSARRSRAIRRVAVPVGNTLMTKPGPRVEKPKLPSGDGTGGFVPVADIYISQHAEKIWAPNGEDIYPPEAKRLGIEGMVRLKLSIDETGKVVQAKVVERAGHGFDEAAAKAHAAGEVQAGHDQRRPRRPLQHHLDVPVRDRSLTAPSGRTSRRAGGPAARARFFRVRGLVTAFEDILEHLASLPSPSETLTDDTA